MSNSKSSREGSGYEYVVVGRCRKCGKPHLAPFWGSFLREPPLYTSCLCFTRGTRGRLG